MKDKLIKNNLKTRDYFIRKLGGTGIGISAISLLCLLPLNITISKENIALNNEINVLEDKIEKLINSENSDVNYKGLKIELKDWIY